MSALTANIVGPGLCVGCGGCAGVCDSGALEMRTDATGLYRPVLVGRCSGCRRCERVCPMLSLEHGGVAAVTPRGAGVTLGAEDACFAARAPDDETRAAGSSGGVATWLLGRALERGDVDAAWCVSGAGAEGDEPRFRRIDTAQDVRAAAGSKYYPAHIADVLQALSSARDGERFAVTALPCQAAALRSAAVASPKIREALGLVIGLACGQGKTAWYSKALTEEARHSGEQLRAIAYRVKGSGATAYDYLTRVEFEGADGVRCAEYAAPRDLAHRWERREHSPYGCNFCEDLFARFADVCVMDAWVEPYSQDPRGVSLLAARSDAARRMAEELVSHGTATPVDSSVLLASQAGSILGKTAGVELRRGVAERIGLPVPSASNDAPYADGPRAGLAARLKQRGAFMISAAERLGPRDTPHGRLLETAGRALFATGETVSRTVIRTRSALHRRVEVRAS